VTRPQAIIVVVCSVLACLLGLLGAFAKAMEATESASD
jgi:hypothetical protein